MLAELEKITTKTTAQETMKLMLSAVRQLDKRTENLSDWVGAQDMSVMDGLVGMQNEQKETNRALQTMTSDMDNGFDRLSKEIRTEVGGLRHEMKTEIGKVSERLEKVETTIKQMKESVVQEQQETNALLRQLIAKS